MLSLENAPYNNGPTQANFEAYNPPNAFITTLSDVDKTKPITKKYRTDLMNPNRIKRQKQKGVKLFE
jgi:hypothetical protein